MLFAVGAYGELFGPTVHDEIRATPSEVRHALAAARSLNEKSELSPVEILTLYHAEERIGAFRWTQASNAREPALFSECTSYMRSNGERFREVHDGWKGEENYFEPNSFWAEKLRRVSAKTSELAEIEFDLKFKDLIRFFRHDGRAIGKECSRFYAELIRSNPEYLDMYSRDEIDSMGPSCVSERKRFIKLRDALLKEYPSVPAGRKLRAVDPTEVVSDRYFGFC